MSCAINSCCSYNLMHDCYAYLLLNSAVELCPDTSLTFPLQVSKCGCLPAVNIKSILLQCLRGCKASSLQSRAHSIPDKGSAFITWCSESQMRVRPCSAIYHPRSASSHRGRKDLGCVYAPPPPCHLFLKSTRFSVTTVCCISAGKTNINTAALLMHFGARGSGFASKHAASCAKYSLRGKNGW